MAVLTAGAAGTRAGAARRVRGRGYLPGYRVICCTSAVAHGRGRSFPVSAQLAGVTAARRAAGTASGCLEC